MSTVFLDGEEVSWPYPVFQLTLAGSHACGFASPTSDRDYAGIHVVPPDVVLGLGSARDSVSKERYGNRGVPLVKQWEMKTHDIKKFIQMLLKQNGAILEQALACPVLEEHPLMAEVRALAQKSIMARVVRYYESRARDHWRAAWQCKTSSAQDRVKCLLHAYRELLTGIHLMRAGQLSVDYRQLALEYTLGTAMVSYGVLYDLVGMKQRNDTCLDPGVHYDLYLAAYERMQIDLVGVRTRSLPDGLPDTLVDQWSDLLVRIRNA